MDWHAIIGYLSGLYFIRPDLEATTLLRTAMLVHFIDAFLCYFIAAHSGRSKAIWTLAGFGLGIWALGSLFLLPDKKTGDP